MRTPAWWLTPISFDAVVAAALVALTPTTTTAQTVSGVVTAADRNVRLADVSIAFLSTNGELVVQGLTGPDGAFEMALPTAGTYLLEARAIGYRPRHLIVEPIVTEVLTVQLELERLPVQLAPVIVYGLTRGQREFESRRHLTRNFSFDRTQFADLGAHTVGEVIRYGLPGSSFPFDCHPQVYFDGWPSHTFTLEDIPVDWLHGIEMYRTYYDIPLEYRDPFGDRRCGAILIWTRPVGRKAVLPPDSGDAR